MTVKINFGASAKQPSWEDRERDRSRISIDWDRIRRDRIERIKLEVSQGLNPVEARELEADKPEQSKQPRKDFNGGTRNLNGAVRKFDHEEIVRRYRSGETGTAIAKSLGANKATIYGILKKYNIERREYNGGANQFTTTQHG